MKMRCLSFLAGALIILCPLESLAERQSKPVEIQAGVPVTKGIDYVSQIDEAWSRIVAASANDRFQEILEQSKIIDRFKAESGIESLEEQSIFLLNRAALHLYREETEKGVFYIRRAEALSPESARVLLKSLPLRRAAGDGELMSQTVHVFITVLRDPRMLSAFISSVIYPILWALTFAVAFSILWCVSIRPTTIAITKKSFTGRELISGMVFVFPLFFGPLWTLVVWSLYALRFGIPERRLAFLGGVCVILWSALVPIRENLSFRFRDPLVSAVINLNRHDLPPSLSNDLIALSRTSIASPYLHFGMGLYERWRGNFIEATQLFKQSETSPNLRPYALAEQAVTAYHSGNTREADAQFASAEASGLDTAETFLNHSKVKFTLLDTAGGQALHLKGSRLSKEASRKLQTLEELEKVASEKVFLAQKPGVGALRPFLAEPYQNLRSISDDRIALVMPFMKPMFLLVIGGLLIALSLRSHVKTSRQKPHLTRVRTILRCIPGSGFTIIGYPITGALIFGVFILLVFPLIPWPSDTSFFMDEFPGLRKFYWSVPALYGLFVSYAGYLLTSTDSK